MQLKYVGAMPLVSAKGVGFDQTQQDKYTLLNAAIELIKALDFGANERTQHLYHAQSKEHTPQEMIDTLKEYCSDFDAIIESRETKAEALVENLTSRVKNNTTINEDERSAWLNNITLMQKYYYQYVTNESAYDAALHVISDEIHDAKIQEITVPMFRNYGLVFHDLLYLLEHRKSPIDAELTIEHKEDSYIGKLRIVHR